jgi:hypothetical protein
MLSQWQAVKYLVRKAISPRLRVAAETHETAALAHVRFAANTARDLLARQEAGLLAIDRGDSDAVRGLIKDIEPAFLWGVFSEIVATGPSFPTNGHDRVKLHLLHFLTSQRGLTRDQALERVEEVEHSYSQAEPIFDAIQTRGRLAVRNGGGSHFADVVTALRKAGDSG